MFTSKAVLGSACLLGLASLAVADLPAGKLVALPTTDCSSYPEYNATDNTAGPWIIQGDSTGNPDIDGHGDTTAYAREYMPISWGSLAILKNDKDAKTQLRCSNGTLQAYVNEYLSDCLPYCTKPLPDSPSDSQPFVWVDVGISGIQVGLLVFHGEYTSPVVPYQLVVDGKPQDGVYLGSATNATWTYAAFTNTRGQDAFYMNSATTTTQAADGTWIGLIKIYV